MKRVRRPTKPALGTKAATLLEVRGVDAAYGALQVLFDVSLEVPEGGTVALLGTNGAGKSTLLKVVSGLLAASRGSVVFDGRDITRASTEERVGLGIVQLAGGRPTFPSLSVEENLRVGAYPFLRRRALVDERFEEALTLFPQLRSRLGQAAGTLSGGEQQMLALGRCL